MATAFCQCHIRGAVLGRGWAAAVGEPRIPLAIRSHAESALFAVARERYGHRGERWLVFLTGHGERSPERQANFDVSTWSAQLGKRGFKTRSLALGETPKVPENTTALVIAGPRTRLLAGESNAIGEFLQRGGNLLWLLDPGPLYGIEPVAELLGIEVQPGVIVDAASQRLAGDPTALIIANYGSHPIVRNFNQSTVFPQAPGLSVQPPQGWKSEALLDTSARAWSETGSLNGELRLDKGKDIPGPLTLRSEEHTSELQS